MKNTQIFDGADNAAYDIFAAIDEEFALIFPNDTDVALIDEVYQMQPSHTLDAVFAEIWKRRVPKRRAMGIHGILFYECEHKITDRPRGPITRPVAMRKPSIQTAQNYDSKHLQRVTSSPSRSATLTQ